MATLDGTLGGAWSAVGEKQLRWLNTTLANWPKDQPVLHLHAHAAVRVLPAVELLDPRLARGARDPQAVQQRHQRARPHAPGALQRDRQAALDRHAGHLVAVAVCARRRAAAHQADDPRRPGRPLRRRRLGQLTVQPAGRVDNEYKMWRKTVFADAPDDSGTDDNRNQVLSPRIADRPECRRTIMATHRWHAPLLAAGAAALLLLGRHRRAAGAQGAAHGRPDQGLRRGRSWSRCKLGDLLFHGDAAAEKQVGTQALAHRHGLRHVPPLRVGHAPARVPEVPGADERVRHAARHDQLVHREAQRGREDRLRQRGDEGAGGLHLLVEPQLQARPGRH